MHSFSLGQYEAGRSPDVSGNECGWPTFRRPQTNSLRLPGMPRNRFAIEPIARCPASTALTQSSGSSPRPPSLVELPDEEFITCHELALAIARARVFGSSQGRTHLPAIAPHGSRLDMRTSPVRSLKRKTPITAESLSTESAGSEAWRPAVPERFWIESARHLKALQAWVICRV